MLKTNGEFTRYRPWQWRCRFATTTYCERFLHHGMLVMNKDDEERWREAGYAMVAW